MTLHRVWSKAAGNSSVGWMSSQTYIKYILLGKKALSTLLTTDYLKLWVFLSIQDR